MSWLIGGAAIVISAALVLGCTQPPTRQGAGVSRTPLTLPSRTARLPRPQIQLASAPAVSDHDRDRWRDVPVPPPTPTRPAPTRAVRASGLQPGVGLAPGVGVSSVRYTPPQTQPRPAGMLSITQVGLDPAATARDSTTDAVDALEQRLAQGPRHRGVFVPMARGVIQPSDALTAVIGAGRSRVSDSSGFGGVEFLPPIRFSWTTGSPYALGELGLDR